VGPGGIGKTRLALAAARAAEPDLAGGAWLVELAGITDPADVPRAVADALDVRESPERTLAGSIVAALRSRHAIVVLDNCEHVVEGAADLARAIAEGCPDARILATSREGLGLPGERLIAIGPLDPDGAAAELFDERAAAADRSFDAVAGRDAVREICRRLDGVPLAIELAAARARSLSVAGLLERLDDRLRLLTGGRRTDAERHRTLRAAIQWSYDLLPPPERDLFAQLSVFAGRFDLAAAEAVTAVDDAGAVDELLGALVDRSMVIVGDGRFGRRFRLLETMRQFGAERLAEAGVAERAAGRHARWCLAEVARVNGLLAGLGEIEGVARLDALWPDLRAALERACAGRDGALARALVGPVAPEVLLRGRSEIGDWVERILEITAPDDVEMVAFALAWAAQRYTLTQDHGAYESLVRRHGEPDHPLVHHARAFLHEDYPRLAEWTPPAVAALRAVGEDHAAEFYEMDVGAALLNLGRLAEHDVLVGELAERYRRQGPPTLLNWSLMLLGYSARFQGEGERAERFFDEAIDVELPGRTRSPNRPIEARALFRRGDRLTAFRLLRAHVVELLEEESMHGADITAVEFVDMMARSDRLPEAARMLGYLETTNLLDTPVFRTLVADAASAVAASGGGEDEEAAGRGLDDRRALAFMRDALDRIAG
jgi:predicted ATPase